MSKTSKPLGKVKAVSLQQQLKELDEHLAWFEQSDFDLELALAKYEEAMVLASNVEKRLKTVENRVNVLQKKFDRESSS